MIKSVFIGAVEGSRIALDALIAEGRAPAAVVTLSPDQSGRHSDHADLAPIAKAAGSEVIFANDINSTDTIAALRNIAPDICLVIGWSQICRAEFRSVAKIGNIGFHPAPLPRFRGRAVIPWTILLNEKTSGSTLFWLDDGVDSGPILSQRMFPVSSDETAESLYAKHAANLAGMLPETVRLVESGMASGIPQDHSQASYCAKRTPDDGLIDWQDKAENISRFVRAVGSPYPGAFCMSSGEKVIIDRVRSFPESGRYIGLVGQVQSHTKQGFTVRCGDGEIIEVLAWRWSQVGKPRLHSHLLGA